MKQTTDYIDVDAFNLYTKGGEVVLRLIGPSRSYDVYLLPHHAKALAKSIVVAARATEIRSRGV